MAWPIALAGGLVAALAVAVVGYLWCLRQQAAWVGVAQQVVAGDLECEAAPVRGQVGAALQAMLRALRLQDGASVALHEDLLAAAEQAQALSTISGLLASVGGGVDDVAATVARLAAEVVGDGAVLEPSADEDSTTRRHSHHRDPEQARLLAAVSRRASSLESSFASDLQSGRPWVVTEHAKETLLSHADPACLGALRRLSIGSFVALPLTWGGESMGILLVVRAEGSAVWLPSEVRLLCDLASRTAVALANARLLGTLKAEVGKRRRAEMLARRSFARQRELLERMLDLSGLERRRIAAEVHDDAVQVMTAALMTIGRARLELEDRTGVLATTEEMLSTSITRLRSLLFQLAPPDLSTHGLGHSLRRLAGDVFADALTEATVDVPDAPLVGQTGEVVFRIVREALLNARKHADAGHVTVRLRRTRGGVRVEVVDDGRGVGQRRVVELLGHMGVASMSERAEAVGGWLRLNSTDHGTTVTFWLPQQAAPDGASASDEPGKTPLAALQRGSRHWQAWAGQT